VRWVGPERGLAVRARLQGFSGLGRCMGWFVSRLGLGVGLELDLVRFKFKFK
jgi:hypothetical protein